MRRGEKRERYKKKRYTEFFDLSEICPIGQTNSACARGCWSHIPSYYFLLSFFLFSLLFFSFSSFSFLCIALSFLDNHRYANVRHGKRATTKVSYRTTPFPPFLRVFVSLFPPPLLVCSPTLLVCLPLYSPSNLPFLIINTIHQDCMRFATCKQT